MNKIDNNQFDNLISSVHLFARDLWVDKETNLTSKRCFYRMGFMLLVSFIFGAFLVYLNACSCLISLNALWVNIVFMISLIVWAFFVYYKREGEGAKM